MAPEPVTIPLFCPKCGGAIELEVSPPDPGIRPRTQSWNCPYCHEEARATLNGTLRWVTERSESSSTN